MSESQRNFNFSSSVEPTGKTLEKKCVKPSEKQHLHEKSFLVLSVDKK